MQSLTIKLRTAPSDFDNDENDDDAQCRKTLMNYENGDESDAAVHVQWRKTLVNHENDDDAVQWRRTVWRRG